MAQRSVAPLDLVEFSGQNPAGPDAPAVDFTMRMGIVHTFAHLQMPNLVLASKLIPLVLQRPMVIVNEWKDHARRGYPRNLMYCKSFENKEINVNGVIVRVPAEANVFGISVDSRYEVFDYRWYEKCEQPGCPKGFDNPAIGGGPLWMET